LFPKNELLNTMVCNCAYALPDKDFTTFHRKSLKDWWICDSKTFCEWLVLLTRCPESLDT